MKVTRLEIKDFNQFRDLDIDLTYPKGHEKEGHPLEKVCFIGQSGTGKTTLLKLIYGLSYDLSTLSELDFDKIASHVYVTCKFDDLILKRTVNYLRTEEKPVFVIAASELKGVPIAFEIAYKKHTSHIHEIQKQLIYFPSSLKNIDDGLNTKPHQERSKLEGFYAKNLFSYHRYDFSKINIYDVWKVVLTDLQKFQEKEIILAQKIANIATEENAHTLKLQEVIDELKQLRSSPSNPIVQIANQCLDPLLVHFNLKVKTESDIKTKDDIGFIKIMDNKGNEIPNGLLSTGTQQIILSALPLYLLKPEKTLILFDEPERSLFPDMQKLVIDYYSSFAKDSQFFYATHSPIIASCFEPWEIIELKFDEDGNVVQDKYYEGERHVDNYTINPQYLTYDLMLSKIFNVKEPLGNTRNMKITEMLTQKQQLDKLKSNNQTDTPEFKTLLDAYLENGKKLFWDTNLA